MKKTYLTVLSTHCTHETVSIWKTSAQSINSQDNLSSPPPTKTDKQNHYREITLCHKYNITTHSPRNSVKCHLYIPSQRRDIVSLLHNSTTYIPQYGQIAALPRTNRTICRTAIRTASALFCPQPEQAGAPLEAQQKNAVALCRRRGDWLCRHAQHTRQHLRQPHQLLRNE